MLSNSGALSSQELTSKDTSSSQESSSQLSQNLKQLFATYHSLCLVVQNYLKKNNTVENQQKFKRLPAKMVTTFKMLKTEIASFEQEFENNCNLEEMNSKYVLLNDKIKSIIIQLKEFLTFHGLKLVKK